MWAVCLAVLAALGASASAQDPAASPAGVLKPQRLAMTNNRTAYYQLTEGEAKGTAVIVHGCGPGARAYFPQHPVDCPECFPYPEYIAQTKLALASGYHALVLQSTNEGSGCWSSSASKEGYIDDRPHVVNAVVEFLKLANATDLPVYYQGYSSGGTMLLKLPGYLLESDRSDELRVDGIVSVDAAPRGGFGAEGRPGKLKAGLRDFPPVLYVAMQGGGAHARAPGQIEFLRNNSVPADLITKPPSLITPTFFSDRVPGLAPDQSAALVAALQAGGQLTPEGAQTGVSAFDAAVQQFPWLAADAVLREGIISELFVAAGAHSNMGEYTAAALAWLESGGRADLAQLQQQLVPAQMSQVSIQRSAAPAPAPAPA